MATILQKNHHAAKFQITNHRLQSLSLLFLVSTETEISVSHYDHHFTKNHHSVKFQITEPPPPPTKKTSVSGFFPSVDGNGKFVSAIMKKCINV